MSFSVCNPENSYGQKQKVRESLLYLTLGKYSSVGLIVIDETMYSVALLGIVNSLTIPINYDPNLQCEVIGLLQDFVALIIDCLHRLMSMLKTLPM